MSKIFYEKHKAEIEKAISNDAVMKSVKQWVNSRYAQSNCPLFWLLYDGSCSRDDWSPVGKLICRPFFGSDHSSRSCPCHKYSFPFVKRRITYLITLWEGKKEKEVR